MPPAPSIPIGCQTYTWEMLGADWTGRTADILAAIAAAGYAGLEITRRMTGEFRHDPQGLARACQAQGLTLTTLAFSAPTGFTNPAYQAAELAAADEAIVYARAAGCRTLGLGGAAIRTPGVERAAGRRQAATIYTAIGRRAAAAGLLCHLHPSSHHGSVIEREAEYEAILAETDPQVVHFGPDLGHLLSGGVDPLPFLRRHRHRIVHVHIKDIDAAGDWTPLGTGRCATRAVMAFLAETAYPGWVMLEEEAATARADPAAAIQRNRAYLHTLGY